MFPPRLMAVMVAIATCAFVVSPFLVPGFGGFDPNRFPVAQVDPPAQPAGYAFSIWGLIYAWLIVHAAFGLVQRADDAAWATTRSALIVSLGVGAFWLPVAKVSPLWAFVLIWIMLIAALIALFRSGRSDPWLLRAPLSIYAGWLTAASWVSVAINAAGYGVLFGNLVWAWIAVAGLTIMGVWVQLRLPRTPGYGLTLTWALVALAVQNFALGNTVLGLAAAGLSAGFAVLAARPFLPPA